jgi:hypothetical protein
MKRLSLLILVFAILSLIFFILLIFLRIPFPLYPLMSYQDAIDLLTPLILIPIYWLLFKHTTKDASKTGEELAFMVLASLWVLGHGIHLAANSINNLVDGLAKTQVLDIKDTDIYALTYFLDEHLSHYLWHIGIVGLAFLLIYREWHHPAGEATNWWMIVLGGIIYGFTWFCIFLEGQTVPLGLPFVIIVVLLTWVGKRKQLSGQPVAAFFFVSCLVAFLLFAGWGLYWGDFRQISETGLI